jgi:hypothetical protein
MTTAFDPKERSWYEAPPAEEGGPPASAQVQPPAPVPHSASVDGLLSQYRDKGPVSAGVLVETLLSLHGQYVAEEVTPDPVAALGSKRTAAQHIADAERRWDGAKLVTFSGRHVLLALAMDADVGWSLLRSGVIASVLARWRPGSGTPQEPYRLVWDVLSQLGRELAEAQPLLAAAFGAPPEWSAQLPEPVTLLALSPGADRVAALAGGTVYEAGAGDFLRRVNDVDDQVVALSWAKDGVVALRITGSAAELTQVATRSALGVVTDVSGGRLGTAGLPAWLEGSSGVVRSWSLGNPQESAPMTPPGAVLTVDGTGRRGLVNVGGQAVLVSTLSEDEGFALPPGSSPAPPPNWPTGMAHVLGVGPPPAGPCALLAPGDQPAVASAAPDGGVVVGGLSSPPLAHIASGPDAITALASDSEGHTLAVAIGNWICVWPLGQTRPAARSIPGYDSDNRAGEDLLDADRDAFALAALIASCELRPPLAIGLFGDWGSGKTFVLDRIGAELDRLTGPGSPEGYLKNVPMIPFNAWHYAETNLWASLVDQVIRKIEPEQLAPAVPEVTEANRLAKQAEDQCKEAVGKLTQARCETEEAKTRFIRQRQKAWALGIVVLLLAAVVVVLVALGESARVVGLASVAAAVLGSLAAAVAQLTKVSGQATEIIDAGRAGLGVLSRVSGRAAGMAAQAAVLNERKLAAQHEAAAANAAQLRAAANRAEAQAKADVVGTVLGHLSSVTEYREQLSLVARTRERFDELNRAITESAPADRKRFVIVIDDLDRCAPENVVKVLEAVHLLFNYEMFVVVLAVDTRWLAQSLQIRYRQLLGETGSAGPYDYLEKIIQIPVHLLPLDEALVRTMITGLTGVPLTPPSEPDDPTVPAPHEADGSDAGAGRPSAAGAVGTLVAHHARAGRPSLPAEVLKITPDEATALSAVAPLVGTTPRTVKRFVNTYRLLKARADDPAEFDRLQGSIGDHEVVAFLLAVVTGRPAVYQRLMPALICAPDRQTLKPVAAALTPPTAESPAPSPPLTGSAAPNLAVVDPAIPVPPASAPAGAADPALADVLSWIARNPSYANAPAHRYAKWALEVARFSFTPTTADVIRAATLPR